MEEMSSYYYTPPPPHPHQPPPPPPSDVHSAFYKTHYHAPPQQHPPTTAALHHSHHLPPPSLHPSSSYSHHPQPPHSSHDEVRTLFVAGLPEDVKPRELYNLFRDFPGYLSSNLRSPSKSSQPFAFVVFADQKSAVTAMHEINGMVFDLEKGSTLYIDLAKSNSRSKRQRTDDEGPASDKKHKGSPALSRGSVELGIGSFHIHGMGNSAYNTIGYPSAQSRRSHSSRGISEANAAKSSHSSASHIPQDNPPCPTIFVANLGPRSSEQELTQVFSRCRGFLKLKIQGTYGAPVAFVDFQDTACSTEALSQLQGTVLISSSSGDGLRLEYAKSRMGMRRKPK
ncbi:RNA binding protein fox-1 homolog 3-like isoform X2 [Chenopodium quinoa]|uniref:RNA binding protein fox-1 homolog 3-like isoform X2 n=1 Tax=Chenopodium quinoa TaxID=63459 RepID=UPI000B78F0A9|nr:RNA binding protein fox-1 homolog 3-like isoform X2 [Chenopodium quinoa]